MSSIPVPEFSLFSVDSHDENVPDLQSEFTKIIEGDEAALYLDLSRHDLTLDSRDPDEESSRSKRRTLFCFHCNRKESHGPATHYRWSYSFLIGLTLGLIKLVGPFYCRCCGNRRLLGSDRFNPRYWLLQRRLQIRSKSRRSRR